MLTNNNVIFGFLTAFVNRVYICTSCTHFCLTRLQSVTVWKSWPKQLFCLANYFIVKAPFNSDASLRAHEGCAGLLVMTANDSPVSVSRSQFATASRQQTSLLTREIPWSASFRGVVDEFCGPLRFGKSLQSCSRVFSSCLLFKRRERCCPKLS